MQSPRHLHASPLPSIAFHPGGPAGCVHDRGAQGHLCVLARPASDAARAVFGGQRLAIAVYYAASSNAPGTALSPRLRSVGCWANSRYRQYALASRICSGVRDDRAGMRQRHGSASCPRLVPWRSDQARTERRAAGDGLSGRYPHQVHDGCAVRRCDRKLRHGLCSGRVVPRTSVHSERVVHLQVDQKVSPTVFSLLAQSALACSGSRA
jgi:hypothetical protein